MPTLHGMTAAYRAWLLNHLVAQAQALARFTEAAAQEPLDSARLILVRDEVFTIRETLETLGVPLATDSNAEWSRRVRSSEG
jgi:hypothetical protein